FVSYALADGVATITMDDGNNNLLSPVMQSQLNKALDQAERDAAVVLLCGRPGIFSAGFDLAILKSGAGQALGMLIGGFKLSARLLTFPTPVLIACPGHAVAMGSFLLLSADYRMGVQGDFKIMANEVAIGLTMPHTAIEICRHRLHPAHFDRAVGLSECYSPAGAVDAGFLDKVVPEQELMAMAQSLAAEFTSLDKKAHRRSKLRFRKQALKRIRRAIHRDRFEFIKMGLSMAFKGSKRKGG
ncbi:MAG: crotonase/enoyl-CoA hydratase family protein, partial [Gammaproteobacteria bacterium]|nr:crotonase/enoyl-CoA hydratase family protein [Gammaproteobacteria bacterium]